MEGMKAQPKIDSIFPKFTGANAEMKKNLARMKDVVADAEKVSCSYVVQCLLLLMHVYCLTAKNITQYIPLFCLQRAAEEEEKKRRQEEKAAAARAKNADRERRRRAAAAAAGAPPPPADGPELVSESGTDKDDDPEVRAAKAAARAARAAERAAARAVLAVELASTPEASDDEQHDGREYQARPVDWRRIAAQYEQEGGKLRGAGICAAQWPAVARKTLEKTRKLLNKWVVDAKNPAYDPTANHGAAPAYGTAVDAEVYRRVDEALTAGVKVDEMILKTIVLDVLAKPDFVQERARCANLSFAPLLVYGRGTTVAVVVDRFSAASMQHSQRSLQ